MPPKQITRQRIFRVLIAGVSVVILLLAAAASFGIRNIEYIRSTSQNLVREQAVSRGLIEELKSQQTSLSEVFSVLARDPDQVDYYKIMAQIDEADRHIDHISGEGEQTRERDLWLRLRKSSSDFSNEARRLLSVEEPETFQSIDLFRYHAAFASVVARLLEAEYHKVNAAQMQIDQRAARLANVSLGFASAAVLLAVLLAGVTIRMVTQLVGRLEWQTAELGRVSWHMLEDQEATARRFSHELHDELGQSLTAVKTNLTAMQAAPADPVRMSDCLKLVDEAIGNVRQMSHLLRPTILDDFGLEAGLRWLAEGFRTRTGIEVTVDSQYPGRLPDETETHLFRIAQEALTNVARHSGAKHVKICMGSDDHALRLSIADDGCGLANAPGEGRGFGMIGMRARARSAGGDLTVQSKASKGVVIEVRVPLRK